MAPEQQLHASRDSSPTLTEFVNGAAMLQAVSVAARLGIADHLAEGPATAESLATRTSAHLPALRRLLWALASIGYCEVSSDNRYALTEAGRCLQTETPGSLRHWAVWWGRYLWPELGRLHEAVTTGRSGREYVRASGGLDYLEEDPAAAEIFNKAMDDLARLVAPDIAAALDVSRFHRIADVGGGRGALLGMILRLHPECRGLLVERPHALSGARECLERQGVLERCELIEADFFTAIPAGADAYLLKSVLHDWDDGRCAVILRNCRAAMSPGARLFVIEQIAPASPACSPQHRDVARRDLTMMIGPGGSERAATEFDQLLRQADFLLVRTTRSALNFHVIEAVPNAM